MATLADLLQRGAPLSFTAHAHRILRDAPHAPDLAHQTFDVLLDLGFGSAARDLLSARRDLALSPDRAQELHQRCSAAPPGRVAWETLAGQFTRNMTVVAARFPALVEPLQQARAALRTVQLFVTRDGKPALSQRQPGALRSWQPFTTSEDESALTLPKHPNAGPVACYGVRPGALIDRCEAQTRNVLLQYSHPIYLMEPDPLHAAAWLHLCDVTALLEQPRTRLWIGADCLADFERCLIDDCNLLAPAQLVNVTGEAGGLARMQSAVRSIEAARADALAAVQTELATRYAARSPADWARRWRQPGTALGITSRYTTMLQYSMRDTLAALQRIGWRTNLVIEPDEHHRHSALSLCRRILDVDPDLLISLDHLRSESPALPLDVPFLCWIQDPMPLLFSRAAGQSVSARDFVCGFYRQRCIDEFDYPPDQFVSVKVPVCAQRFHNGPVDPASAGSLEADVCFVSHASRPPAALLEQALRDYPPAVHPLLHALYADTLALLDRDESLDFQTSAADLTAHAAQRCGLRLNAGQLEHFKSVFTFKVFDWGRRHQTLEWVAAWARATGRRLRIYGKGWEQHPTLAEFAGGVAAHGEHLRQIYRCSALSLQLLSAGFLHQRSFEAIASGSLPLTRHCRESDDFAGMTIEDYDAALARGESPGGSVSVMPGIRDVTFRNASEFAALAERFLSDSDARVRTLDGLRTVVQREFTYDAVLGRVTEAFREHLLREPMLRRAESASVQGENSR